MHSPTLTTTWAAAAATEAMAPEGLDCLVTLVEHVCALPAVATLDWCDRAAHSFAALIPGSTAIVMLGNGRVDGTICSVESFGIARHAGATAAEMTAVRAQAERLTTLDLDLSTVRAGKTLTGWISNLYGERTSAALELLENVQPSEAALGVCSLGEPSAGRILCVIVGAGGGMPEWVPGVLSSILPSLSRKVLVAIGASTSTRSGWISPREQMVLEQLILGKSVKQIADDLGRSPHTVHDHVKALHRKLNASSRGELVARALGHLIEGARIRHPGTSEPGQDDGRRAA